MKRSALLLLLPLLFSVACHEGTDPLPGQDASSLPDGGETLCYRGWSNNSGCCLSSDTLPAIGQGCPTGYFLEAQCGRLDPVCESVDAGPPDAGGLVVECNQTPPVFPEFDRSCTVAGDCAVGTRQINCCGTMIVTGISSTVAPDFEAAAGICASQYPDCRCATEPTRADDGTTRDNVLDEDAIAECVDNVCRTTFPQTPQPCGPSLRCDPADEVCVATSPVGPSIQYACQPVPAGCELDRSCGCVASTLCVAPFDTCTDVVRNEVSCECPQCQ